VNKLAQRNIILLQIIKEYSDYAIQLENIKIQYHVVPRREFTKEHNFQLRNYEIIAHLSFLFKKFTFNKVIY